MAFYIVVSPTKVYVDYLNGTVLGFSTGQVFDAPLLPSVSELLRAYPPVIVPFTPTEAFVAAPAGEANGAATLDSAGNLTTTQLPTFSSKTFAGVAAPGPATLTGATVGQTVVAIWILDGSVMDVTGEFEATITVDDQIQQTSATDYSTKKFAVLLA